MNAQTAVIEPEVIEPLALEDRAALADLEKSIEENRGKVENSFREIGDSLNAICDRKLYRGDFKTFDAYVKTRWEMSPRRAYQIIEARNTFKLLANTVQIPNESVARQLSGLTNSEKIEAGKRLAKKEKKNGKIEAKDAHAAAIKVSAKKAKAEAKRKEREEKSALKKAEAIRKKKEKEQAKQDAASEKQRQKQLKIDAKAAETFAKQNGGKARGGLAAEAAKAKIGAKDSIRAKEDKSPAGIIAKWWTENRANLMSHPPITHNELVAKIVKILENL